MDWLDGIAGPDYIRAVLWTVLALIVLVIVLVVVKLVRSMTAGTFVAGGRNRKTRLAVMDATAVDSHRRLVLVRRDDIEHLLLIGGPTDVVVERDIRLVAARRPVLTGSGPQAAPPQRPSQGQGQGQGQGQAQSRPEPAPARRQENVVAPPVTARPMTSMAASAPPPAYPAAAAAYPHKLEQKPAPAQDGIDETFMDELEMSLGDLSADLAPAPAKASPTAPPSPDDEMAKLLGELSNHKK